MSNFLSGGCSHIVSKCSGKPIDSHVCHCSVCKGVTGQETTHVVFFNFNELKIDHPENLNRQPFNANNPDGPLELCTCKDCGTPIMLDDKQKRIRVIVPNLMGYDPSELPASYHAFFDPERGDEKPTDGRPVYEGLRPDFVWPNS